MRTIAATVLVTSAFLAFHTVPTAQGLGTVAGAVKDASGAVLPGVTVRVASVDLIERVRTTVTNASGQYRLGNMPAGVYTVTFSLVGFGPVVRIGVEVAAGVTTGVDAELRVGPLEFTDRIGPRPFATVPPAELLSRSYVICGLTIVPADPKVDSRIEAPPAGRRSAHSMRTIAADLRG